VSRFKILSLAIALACWQQAAGQSVPGEKPKTHGKALRYSLVSTLAPVALGGLLVGIYVDEGEQRAHNLVAFGIGLGSAGLVFGPGAGHLYAGQTGRFVGGALTRCISGGVVLLGIASIDYGPIFGDSDVKRDNGFAGMLIVVGSAGAIISVIYDIATVGRSVDKFNHEHGFQSFEIQPRYWPQDKAVGLGFCLRF
jgi:hypothetical protein